jgi:hypothetical protein
MRITFSLEVTPYGLAYRYRRVGGICYLHLQTSIHDTSVTIPAYSNLYILVIVQENLENIRTSNKKEIIHYA